MNAAWFSSAFKLMGSFMVVGAGGMAGFWLAGRLEGELGELERLEVALLNLSSEISYSLEPLPGALVRAGERAGGATGALFVRLGSLTGLSQRRTPAEALDQALDGVAAGAPDRLPGGVRSGAPGEAKEKLIPLPTFEVDLLRELAKNLGTSGHKEQVRYIEMSMDRARSRRREFAEECRKKAKLYRYLGIAAGASVAIVLL